MCSWESIPMCTWRVLYPQLSATKVQETKFSLEKCVDGMYMDYLGQQKNVVFRNFRFDTREVFTFIQLKTWTRIIENVGQSPLVTLIVSKSFKLSKAFSLICLCLNLCNCVVFERKLCQTFLELLLLLYLLMVCLAKNLYTWFWNGNITLSWNQQQSI